MSRYSAAQRDEIMRAMRETLDDRGLEEEIAAHRLELEPLEDPVAKWRREMLELEAKRDREQMRTTSELNAERTAQWEAWAVAIVARELAAHDRNLNEVLGQVVPEIRQQLREEFAEQLGQLRAEVMIAKRTNAAKSSTCRRCRGGGGRPMPLSAEVVAARVAWRVALLRVVAASTFVQLSRHGSSGLARQPPPGAVRRPDATHILLDVCALPEAVVFNLVHPVRAARGSLGG
jgi:hypothetical protein